MTGELEVLINIERSLRIIAGALAKAPNIQQPLQDYPDFDWKSIGARVLRTDADGASVVEHNGRIYKRRSPDNKYEACIWFSRCTGKDENGNNHYETLISFETIKDDVEPLGQKAQKALRSLSRQQPTTNHQPPITKHQNVQEITNHPLTESQMEACARRFVEAGAVSFADGKYSVQVNPSTIQIVSKQGSNVICSCDRFKSAKAGFRCEHIRAVALFVAPAKPDQRSELSLLIGDLLNAGVNAKEVDDSIARVCDGLFAVEDLSPEHTAKALRTLQGKLTGLAVQRQAAA